MQRNNPLRWSKSLSDLHAKNINFWQNVLDFQVSLQHTADLVTCMTLPFSDLEAPGSVMASVVFFYWSLQPICILQHARWLLSLIIPLPFSSGWFWFLFLTIIQKFKCRSKESLDESCWTSSWFPERCFWDFGWIKALEYLNFYISL